MTLTRPLFGLTALIITTSTVSACSDDTSTPGDPYADAVRLDAPLAYVRFQDAAVTDVLGRAQVERHGVTIVDGPTGIGARAGAFNGADWISIGEDWQRILGESPTGSFEAWVQFAPESGYVGIVSSDVTPGKGWVAISAMTGTVAYGRYFEDPSSGPASPVATPLAYPGDFSIASPVTEGVFHHVVATFGSRNVFYVDGVQVGTYSIALRLTDWQRIVVGAGSTSGVSASHAKIAEVAIYGGPLTPSQVLAHYNARGK